MKITSGKNYVLIYSKHHCSGDRGVGGEVK